MTGYDCIGCASASTTPFLWKSGPAAKHRNIVLRRCLTCGLCFLEGWSEAFDAELYEYYAVRLGQSKEVRYHSLNTARHRDLLAALGGRLSGRRMLDVGCGEGHLVDTALSLGWAARGIDLARPAIELCQSFGLPCEELDFFSPTLDSERFDLLVMSELIEHVPFPGRFLERAEQLLRPGGLVYLTTPNFDSITRIIVGAEWKEIHREHLSYFSPRTFSELVRRRTGLGLISLETRNIGVASLLTKVRGRRNLVLDEEQKQSKNSRASEQDVRTRVEGSRVLRSAKSAMNRVLTLSGRGDTMVILLEKRSSLTR